MSLDELGNRICILGPSGSGKSTLARAIGAARDLTPVYLDQLRHLPGPGWVERPDDEFARLHDKAIRGDRWVMDGSYSQLLPQRLARATGMILLDCSTGASLWRYLRRTRDSPSRVGGLGTNDSVNWDMVDYIVRVTPGNRRRYRVMFDELALPKTLLPNRRQLQRFYRHEGLSL